MNLTLTLEQEIALLNKYRLTCDELMFIRVTLLYQLDEDVNIFKDYFTVIKSNIRDLLVSLQNKSIINKSYKIPGQGEQLNPMLIEFNKNAIKNIFKASFEMGKELFEAYPQFATINGSLVPLRTVSKHFNSLEDAYTKYGKYIRWNPELHSEIIELLKWASENEILKCSMASFIVNNGWIDLKSMKDGNCSYNYEAIKMV